MPSIDEWIKKYGFVLNGILFGILLEYYLEYCCNIVGTLFVLYGILFLKRMQYWHMLQYEWTLKTFC